MSDNTTVTAGSGTTVATDNVSGAHYQKVKLGIGVADSAVMIGHAEDAGHTTGDGGIMALTVRQNTAAALGGTDADYQPLITNIIGELHASAVGKYASFIENPTVDTSAYADHDIIGGIIEVSNWARATGGAAKLRAITIWTEDGETFDGNILFFKATPTGGTYADQGAATWAAADFTNFLARVSFLAASDWEVDGGDGIMTKSVEIPLPVDATSLFFLLFSDGTPTFGAATDVNIVLLAEY